MGAPPTVEARLVALEALVWGLATGLETQSATTREIAKMAAREAVTTLTHDLQPEDARHAHDIVEAWLAQTEPGS